MKINPFIVIPSSEFIRDECESRNWDYDELKSVKNPEILAKLFDSNKSFWTRLQILCGEREEEYDE